VYPGPDEWETAMAEAVYHGEDDSFSVEITGAGVLPEMAVGSVTEA